MHTPRLIRFFFGGGKTKKYKLLYIFEIKLSDFDRRLIGVIFFLVTGIIFGVLFVMMDDVFYEIKKSSAT